MDTLLIVARDFNAHHPNWNPMGYSRHDEPGDEIIDMATDLGLTLLIPPGMVTYLEAETAIDLTWGNQAVRKKFPSDSDQGSRRRENA